MIERKLRIRFLTCRPADDVVVGNITTLRHRYACTRMPQNYYILLIVVNRVNSYYHTDNNE